MIREATWQAFLKSLNEDPTVRILNQSTEETIHQNPLYRKAQETGDDLLMRGRRLITASYSIEYMLPSVLIQSFQVFYNVLVGYIF